MSVAQSVERLATPWAIRQTQDGGGKPPADSYSAPVAKLGSFATMSELITHWLNVRDKPGLLHRLMREFTGGQMSLEGDLSKCKFADEMVVAHDEIGLLKRITLYPRQDFVVICLEPENVAPIFNEVVAAGLSRAIIHVQIEHGGVLQLGAYDNFHPDCVVAGPGVTATLLEELKSKHVLREYSIAAGTGSG